MGGLGCDNMTAVLVALTQGETAQSLAAKVSEIFEMIYGFCRKTMLFLFWYFAVGKNRRRRMESTLLGVDCFDVREFGNV